MTSPLQNRPLRQILVNNEISSYVIILFKVESLKCFYKSPPLKRYTHWRRKGVISWGMILNDHYQIKLAKQYAKILYLYAAYNDTFVFLAFQNSRKEIVVHVNSSGSILFEHQFPNPMDTMGMLDEKEVIFCETRNNKIVVINLQTYQMHYFPHQFMNEQSDQTDIITFSQTKYLCIQEKGRYNDNRYKLSYFPYPLKIVDSKERKLIKNITVYEAKQAEWTYEHMTRKANNYSMMCWYKPRHDDSFQFKTYQIVQGKGIYKVYKFNTPISVEPHVTKMETAILNVWQLHNKHFLFVCLTNKTQSKKGGGTVINSNYVITPKGEIRQSKFTFGPYQDYLIDYCNLGLYSMFRTYMLEDGIVLKSPTYYIDNESETIMAEQMWECSSLYKYQFPGYSSNTICEGIYQGRDNDHFELNRKRIFKPKDLYLHLFVNCGVELSGELMEDILCVLGVPLS